jgi:hypothetical protein
MDMTAAPSTEEQDVPAAPAQPDAQSTEAVFDKEELQELAQNLDTTVLALLGLC